ncbi:MAG: signal peptidase I [Candidatus Omnitrophota bacterium]
MDKPKAKKVIYAVFLGLLTIVALLVIISAFPVTGNYKFLVVESGSMNPAIRTGSVVMVKPAEEYKIGDVITFNTESRIEGTITHRIQDMVVVAGEVKYITKGDANEDPDPREVQESDIVGKVLLSIPLAGYAVNFAQKPIGFALIIIVPASVIIIDEIKKIYLELKKKKNG